jgi:nucleoside-diphosphate-sugar epimerase
MKNPIAISGASGWLGNQTIEVIGKIASAEPPLLFTSNGRDIVLRDIGKRETQSFLESQTPASLEGFIHLAFLTRDKVETIGPKDFISTNLSLISKACQFIESSKPKWVVTVSSGAILDRSSGALESNIKKNPYGFCKRVEELLIAQSAQKVGASVVIGRLWGASGQLMPPNSAYALSDFIISAHKEKKIIIKSGGKVFRRYLDAGEFMEVLIRAAMSGKSLTINSGGPRVEIGDLAEMVLEHFHEVEIQRPPALDHVDDYYPRGDEFENLAEELGVELTGLKSQVSRTVNGHLTSISD